MEMLFHMPFNEHIKRYICLDTKGVILYRKHSTNNTIIHTAKFNHILDPKIAMKCKLQLKLPQLGHSMVLE